MDDDDVDDKHDETASQRISSDLHDSQKCMIIGSPEEQLHHLLRSWLRQCVYMHSTIRYDTRCYFNVRSKADISQLNLPHGTDN